MLSWTGPPQDGHSLPIPATSLILRVLRSFMVLYSFFPLTVHFMLTTLKLFPSEFKQLCGFHVLENQQLQLDIMG